MKKIFAAKNNKDPPPPSRTPPIKASPPPTLTQIQVSTSVLCQHFEFWKLYVTTTLTLVATSGEQRDYFRSIFWLHIQPCGGLMSCGSTFEGCGKQSKKTGRVGPVAQEEENAQSNSAQEWPTNQVVTDFSASPFIHSHRQPGSKTTDGSGAISKSKSKNPSSSTTSTSSSSSAATAGSMAPDEDKAAPSPPPSRPALPGGAEEYVRDSIHVSLGLPVPDRSLRLKLLASEDLRRRLQDHVFALEEDLYAAARRIDLLKKESTMNAEGIRRCVEEKEALAAARDRLAADAAKLEKEVTLYERDLERAMESCDDLARENEDLRARLKDNPDLTALNNEVQALQRDREILKTNLNKAEEEVKLLFEENKTLDEANKRLVSLLDKEKHRSERKHSASNSTKQKRKSSSLKDTSPVSLAVDFNSVDASRHPLSPLQPNSPDCRVHKK